MPADDDLPEVGDVVRRGGQARFDLDSAQADSNAAPDPTGPSLPRVQDRAPGGGSHQAARPASPIPPVEPPGAHPPPPRQANPSPQPTGQRGGRRLKGWRRAVAVAAPGLVILAIAFASNPPGAPTSSDSSDSSQALPESEMVRVTGTQTLKLTVPNGHVTLHTLSGQHVSMFRVQGCSLGPVATNAAGDTSQMHVTCAHEDPAPGMDITVPAGIGVELDGGSVVAVSGAYRSLTLTRQSERVDFDDTIGNVRVQTTGNVTGTVQSASNVAVTSTYGSVDLTFIESVRDTKITTSSASGSVAVRLPPINMASYDLSLDAHGGTIDSTIPDHAGTPNRLKITTKGGDISLGPRAG